MCSNTESSEEISWLVNDLVGVDVPIGNINPNGLDCKGRSWLRTEYTECVSLDDTEHVSLDEHTECISLCREW